MTGVHPFIMFAGNCQEAIDFYQKAIGAELLYSQKWGETPHAQPGLEDKIMHATIKVGDSNIMMSDGSPEDVPESSNIQLAIGLDDVGKAREMFDNLSDGGSVTMPLDKTFWAEAFGMLTDKFGVKWMVNCDKPHDEAEQASA